jgi:putative hydrolase of HD superfamily
LIEAQRRITALLQPGATCLEYGSGLSTLWLAERCRRLYSVESDLVWYEKIEHALSRRGYRHVTYRLQPDPADYVAFPADEAGEPFDFVLVDGFERARTLRQGLTWLKPNGWLFLDDTDRSAYDAGNAASRQVLLAHVQQHGGELTWLNDLVAHEFRVRQGVLYHATGGTPVTEMHTKAPMLTAPAHSSITTAYFQLQHSKQLYRQGWLRAGLEPAQCESVADHSHGVALLCRLLLGLPEYDSLDPLKVAALAALHDAGEVYAGDLTPAHHVAPAEKERRERQAIRQIFGPLAGGERYVALWEEYAAHSSPEARFVSQVDKLEMALQAVIYHRQGIDVAEFIASARQVISDPPLQVILADVERLVTEC